MVPAGHLLAVHHVENIVVHFSRCGKIIVHGAVMIFSAPLTLRNLQSHSKFLPAYKALSNMVDHFSNKEQIVGPSILTVTFGICIILAPTVYSVLTLHWPDPSYVVCKFFATISYSSTKEFVVVFRCAVDGIGRT
jgi:hypothetical protein